MHLGLGLVMAAAVSGNAKKYVVTGASGGIGLELVKQLAARGDKVYATCRKRESSATGIDAISEVEGDVTVIEGIDVTSDSVGAALAASPLAGVEIDVVVHNAGGIAAETSNGGAAVMGAQSFANVTPQMMMDTFSLNALGPLRVQQALDGQLKRPGGKICIISTGMGSIGDNGSGGLYAYRTSKAAVNMVTKNMSIDHKEAGIAVVSVNPGMVITNFGPGSEMLANMNAMPVSKSVEGLLTVFDDLTMETTGSYMSVKKDGPPKVFEGGW